MLGHAMQCHVVQCNVMPCHVMYCRVMPCHAQPSPGHVLPCNVMRCGAMSSNVLWYRAHMHTCMSVGVQGLKFCPSLKVVPARCTGPPRRQPPMHAMRMHPWGQSTKNLRALIANPAPLPLPSEPLFFLSFFRCCLLSSFPPLLLLLALLRLLCYLVVFFVFFCFYYALIALFGVTWAFRRFAREPEFSRSHFQIVFGCAFAATWLFVCKCYALRCVLLCWRLLVSNML